MDAPLPQPRRRGGEAEIEVRPLYELEDFLPSEAAERMRDIGLGVEKK
jgi:hypothetical protein